MFPRAIALTVLAALFTGSRGFALFPNAITSSVSASPSPSASVTARRSTSRTTRSVWSCPTRLYYTDKDDREAIVARNNARTCVKAFLTQRSIQSFMFLSAECRDPHSGKWIEEFLGLQNLSNFHGTGAFDIRRFPSWEMVLLEMMEMPKDEIIVSAKRRGRGHGGWSKDNPYLEE